MAPLLVAHLREQGFTHVEFLPVMEHPLYESWGYQVLGYYAPTSRYGTPQDFKYLVDTLHRGGLRRDPRLGAVPLPAGHPRAVVLRRDATSSSTPIRGRACTLTGTRSSTTTAGTR